MSYIHPSSLLSHTLEELARLNKQSRFDSAPILSHVTHVARAILGLCLDHNCKSHVTIVTNHKTRSNKVKHGVKVDTDDSNVNIIGHLVF